MQSQKIVHWGAADLRGFSTPKDGAGQGFTAAISWVIPMTPQVMADIRSGPNQAYADEYDRVNQQINELAGRLAAEISSRGWRAQPLAASVRSDPVNIKGDFPHKTAATRAGLGWIGRHCQLVTHKFGSWVRLGTVFTDLELPLGAAQDPQLLRPLHPLRGGLPGRGLDRQLVVSGPAPGSNPGRQNL
jgi:epoxyqueuosine reductase